jgi:hypothetical protein
MMLLSKDSLKNYNNEKGLYINTNPLDTSKEVFYSPQVSQQTRAKDFSINLDRQFDDEEDHEDVGEDHQEEKKNRTLR